MIAVDQYLPAVPPNSDGASGARDVFGFGSVFGIGGISLGGTTGVVGATIAGPVEQPVCVEPYAAGAEQVSHELECFILPFRRLNRQHLSLLHELVVKPV